MLLTQYFLGVCLECVHVCVCILLYSVSLENPDQNTKITQLYDRHCWLPTYQLSWDTPQPLVDRACLPLWRLTMPVLCFPASHSEHRCATQTLPCGPNGDFAKGYWKRVSFPKKEPSQEEMAPSYFMEHCICLVPETTAIISWSGRRHLLPSCWKRQSRKKENI